MIGCEWWNLGAANARVVRCGSYAVADVRGMLTAQGYEALHARLSREPGVCTAALGPALLFAVTNRSAVEAAIRGMSFAWSGKPVKLLVPAFRRAWAERHCKLMALEGLSCAASVLPEQAPQWAPRRAQRPVPH